MGFGRALRSRSAPLALRNRLGEVARPLVDGGQVHLAMVVASYYMVDLVRAGFVTHVADA